ncbi:MAG: hypothetical protein QGD96_05365 [Anaerolineae bacterium]|nr:hypothetical protein [Anaerolineae bacterium]
MKQAIKSIKRLSAFLLLSGFAIISTGCQFSLIELPSFFPGVDNSTATPEIHSGPTQTAIPMAQVTFIAVLPEPLAEGESLAIAILDEITGLALNRALYPLQERDSQSYAISLPFNLNSIIKYRYIRRTNVQLREDSGTDVSIRYRLYQVNGPGETRDIIASWIDRSYNGAAGSIEGEVYEEGQGPLANILVTAGGVQTITDSAGRFDLEGLPPGTHNLVAYAIDGSYKTFQQGATVLENLNTPVKIYLTPEPFVNVTFNLSTPTNTMPGAPVRLGGNLFQLGNTFSDLRGGLSTIADRMPVMTALPEGRYTVTLRLPAGEVTSYKYTLGDGFWNAEHKSNSEFKIRQLVVPREDTVIYDTVETWQAGSSAPILFEVKVPANTPVGDIIYIQFNPYGWTEPLPMWPVGDNRWVYKLYSPLSILGSFGYRYCRAGQCGSADDLVSMGDTTSGRQVTTSLAPQNIKDTVKEWAWLENTEPGNLVGVPVNIRQNSFVAGIELQPTLHPNWVTSMPQAMKNIQEIGSNYVILTPTWTYSKSTPLVLGPIPGKDSFWNDTFRMVTQARGLNMNVALFPTPRFEINADEFWGTVPKNNDWWQTWFDHYRAFVINYADLATQSGAQTLILGGDWIEPALPGGMLPDGTTSSDVPEDAETRWKSIIAEVRSHFHGTILWALPYEKEYVDTPLGFLNDIDGIYLLWSLQLSNSSNPTKAELINESGRLLDTNVSALASLMGKPIIIALAYPSADGAASGCLSNGEDACLHWTELSPPNPDVKSLAVNLQLQADIYEAMLTAINEREWVGGIVSRSYYPPTILQDKSASIRGKPASDIIWYWYPRMLGTIE